MLYGEYINMKKQNNALSIALIIFAFILLICGIILSFQNKSTNIATYSAAVICLIISQLGKFESFEGLGVKAKLKEVQENIETMITLSTAPADYVDTNTNIASVEDLRKELGLSVDAEHSLDKIIKKFRNEKYNFRTLSGLGKDTGLTIHSIKKILLKLYDKGYLRKVNSESKGVLWALSDKGQKIKQLVYNDE